MGIVLFSFGHAFKINGPRREALAGRGPESQLSKSRAGKYRLGDERVTRRDEPFPVRPLTSPSLSRLGDETQGRRKRTLSPAGAKRVHKMSLSRRRPNDKS